MKKMNESRWNSTINYLERSANRKADTISYSPEVYTYANFWT